MKFAAQKLVPPTHKSGTRLTWLQRLNRFWVEPVEAVRVRTFECLFTITFLIWMGRCFTTWEEWLTDKGFHLNAAELRSIGYPEPWPLLAPWQVGVLAASIVLFSLALLWPVSSRSWRFKAPSWFRRVGLIGLFFCAFYVQRADFMASFTLNKLFVGIFAVLALSPGMWHDPTSGRLLQSAAPLRVLQATLIFQYFAAGLAKANGDWFKGHDVLWGQVQGVYRTEWAAWALRNFPSWAWAVQQHVSFAFELLAPLFFLVRKLLPLAFILGIGFHLIIALMMKDLIFFSLQMWTFYVLFLPPSFFQKVSAWPIKRNEITEDAVVV